MHNLNNRESYFLTIMRLERPSSSFGQGSVSAEGSLPGPQMAAVSSHGLPGAGVERAGWGLPHPTRAPALSD